MPQALRIFTGFCFSVLLLTLICSCNKNKTADPASSSHTGSLPDKPSPGVYIAGDYAKPGSHDSGYVWKANGSVYFKTPYTYTYGFTTSNGDLYTVGLWSGDPAYWKNGEMTKLPSTGAYAFTGGIAVTGSDVYVLGSYYNLTINDVTYGYWKNEVYKPVKDTALIDIASSGSDIYMLGVVSGRYFYRKNNTVTAITNFTANNIRVFGNDVYIVGFVPDPTGSSPFGIAAYWKNGIVTKIGPNIDMIKIFVKSNDVYLAYRTGSDFVYSKNGVVTQLDPNIPKGSNGKADRISGMCVDNAGNVYIAGVSRYGAIGGIGSLWKNGVKTDLTLPSDAMSIAGIAIIE